MAPPNETKIPQAVIFDEEKINKKLKKDKAETQARPMEAAILNNLLTS